jgi:hypothetical protein
MTTRRAALAIALLALTGLSFLGGAWWRDRAAVPAPLAVNALDSLTAEEARTLSVDTGIDPASGPSLASDGTAAQAPSAGWPPLPAVGVPLADVFDELAARGRRGDAAAACRLAADLSRCTMARYSRSYASDAERDLARRDSTPDQAVQSIARAQAFSEAQWHGCDGLEDRHYAGAFDWQRQAAILDPSLRLAVVLRPALNPRDFITDLDRWAEYRRLALPWLEAAAREGDAAAVIALARVYGDHRAHTMLAPPFRIRDDQRFVQYAELMEHYGVGLQVVRQSASQAAARLSPEAQAVARQRAMEMLDPGMPPLDATAADKAHAASLRASIDAERCGESRP